MNFYSIKCLYRNIKYSWLKYKGWVDAFYSTFLAHGESRIVYVNGKGPSNVVIKKHEKEKNVPEGIFPWYVEFRDGSMYNIHFPDEVMIDLKSRLRV